LQREQFPQEIKNEEAYFCCFLEMLSASFQMGGWAYPFHQAMLATPSPFSGSETPGIGCLPPAVWL